MLGDFIPIAEFYSLGGKRAIPLVKVYHLHSYGCEDDILGECHGGGVKLSCWVDVEGEQSLQVVQHSGGL